MSRTHKITVADLALEYEEFNKLLKIAEGCLSEGRPAAAAGLARMAAKRAFPHHVGIFASARLERLLLGLGRQITVPLASSAGVDEKLRRNVLHVLTYARPVGGDTRFAWRWMQLDKSSRHSVAIIAQTEVEHLHGIPEALEHAATASGGFVHALRSPSTKPLDQARELRALCQGMDVVVLHLFPHDIIPVLALASGCESVKVAFVNHADHTFWVGGSVTDVLVHLRNQSPEFLAKRRGLPEGPCMILPIPLEVVRSSLSRSEAKRALGLSPDTVVLLTIATAFKYDSLGDVAFLDLVQPVVQALPQTVLLAVGPDPTGNWALANQQTGGRIKALGTRSDNDLRYAAADVYLDSVPTSSITSLLEAGIRGVPLLSFTSLNPELGLLSQGAPGLDGVIEVANDPESYRQLLRRFIEETEFRHKRGNQVMANILGHHAEDGWTKTVDKLYTQLKLSSRRISLAEDNDAFRGEALDLALTRLYAGIVRNNLRHEIQESLGDLPYHTRLLVLRRLARNGFRPHWLNLMPPPLDDCTRWLVRWLRTTIQFKSKTRKPMNSLIS